MRLACMLLVFFLLGACTHRQSTPTFQVAVSSASAPDSAKKKTYLLIPGNDGVTWADSQFKEYAGYLIRVLRARDFELAKSPDEADLVIALSYGIGDPQKHKFSYKIPTREQTGMVATNTVSAAPLISNTRAASTISTYTPNYGIPGYNTVTKTATLFFRYAVVVGLDFQKYKNRGKPEQVWKTTLTSIGSSGDLKRVFPVLMAASAPYISGSTKKQVSVSIQEENDLVRAIKGLPAL